MTSEQDAYLDSVLIGGREQRAIEIVEYDDEWARLFAGYAGRIAGALGDGAIAIEHIGSTSVQGLAAKPIIDILVVMPDVEEENDYVSALEGAGFVLRVREPGHRLFRTPLKDAHIHVLSTGVDAIQDYRDLRDWLLVSSSDRELYAATKRRLAAQTWTDMNYYADAKTDVIAEILGRARAWRRDTAA